MALRDFRLKIKNSDIVNRPLPSQLFPGEPIVNTADGVMYFSGITTSSQEWTSAGTGATANFFEVGSNLYDLALRNRIIKYEGVTGAGLVDKYLKGTASGFVLDDISNITTSDSYVSGATFNNGTNLLTLNLTEGKPNVTAYIDITSASGLTLNHNTQLTSLQGGESGQYFHINGDEYAAVTGATNPSTSNPFATLSDIAAASGDTQQVKVSSNDTTPGFLEDKLSGSTNISLSVVNEGGNEFIFIDTTHTIDTNNYVTGNTGTVSATNNDNKYNTTLVYNQDPGTGPHILGLEDTFVSGGTLSGNNLLLTRNDGVTLAGIDLSSLATVDTFVTGFTYDNAGTLTIYRNQGQDDLDVTIDTFDNLNVDGDLTMTSGGTLTVCTILPTSHLSCDIGAVGSRFDEIFVRKVKLGTSTTDLVDDGAGLVVSGNTGDFNFYPAEDFISHAHFNPGIDLGYNLGSPSERWDTVYVGDISATGLTITGLGAGRVVYTDGGGSLTTEAGFEYNEANDLLTVGNLNVANQSGTTANIGQGGLVIGSGGAPGNNPGVGDLTVHGNLTVYGTETIVDTTNLYVEDNNITINYNPTGDTSSTYLGAGFTIQDGDGAGTDIVLATGQMFSNPNINSNSEYTSATGAENLSFFTSMNDLLIRNTNGNSGAPDGKRVLAEDDCLDGGTY